MSLLGGLGNGPTFMSPMVFWALLAVIVAAVGIGVGIGVSKFIAAGKSHDPFAAPDAPLHNVAKPCRDNGHAYAAFDTGWRCSRCGNHVSGREGELYGLAEDGRHERRRQAR
jgi:hypothetical protein